MDKERIDEKVYDEAYTYGLDYWNDLNNILEKKEYLEVLKEDLKEWNNKHINKGRFSYNLIRKDKIKGYMPYLKYIKKKGMLDNYLDRSISYIFMRDLGKDIAEKDVFNKIREIVKDISESVDGKEKNIELEKIYSNAKRDGKEELVIWIINKIREISENMPEGIDKVSAIRKIIKVIAGVLMYRVWGESVEEKEISKSIKIGYAYGITYPYIDDLLDSKILNEKEEEEYSNIIRETLISGKVPKKEWNSENKEILNYVQSQLEEAFNYIKENGKEENSKEFLELAYIFFYAQELDRKKDLDKEYKSEEIFVPVILKSAASRLIIPTILGEKKEDFNSMLFYYGIYNQLADDFTDMEEDYKSKRVTPYTYYMKNREKAINPFKVYFVVIYYLIHKIYKNNSKVKDIILCRVINSLRRFKEKEYDVDFIKLDDSELDRYLEDGIKKARDIEFYDKLLRDEIIKQMNEEKEKKRKFKEKINIMKKEIDNMIGIKSDKSKIVEATNYSLYGNGKRLRSIITWIVGIESYGLKKESLVPLIKSLEYMHTASLILDDLPSQDNADLRRGRETVHKKYGVAIAELTSVFLTQQGIQEQINLRRFNKEKILELIEYTTEVIKKMCKGQIMDLEGKEKNLSEDELEEICFYKTGIAFEAAIIMPAILGNAKEEEKEKLKKFSKYAGVAFQIKDDMLDVVGEREKLGKEIGIDKKNKTSTFVTVLGYEEAEKKLFEYYVLAIESIKGLEINLEFLKELMNYIMNRKN